ncbi:hypothetical protein Tco_0317547 [Tanacetum coccineum]
MDKGLKERSPPHNLGRNWVNTYSVRITMLIADIEDDIMDPVMQCTTLPSYSGFSQQKLVSFVTEIHTTSIDFLTPIEKHALETNEPKTARKENRALIIEDWVFESEEDDIPKVNTVEIFNKPSFAKINFVKSTEQVKSPRKTSVDKNRQHTPSPRGSKRN